MTSQRTTEEMSLRRYFHEGDRLIPAELVWAALDDVGRRKAFRMLRSGELEAEGRMLVENPKPYSSSSENIKRLRREDWVDAVELGWFENYKPDRNLQLGNKFHQEHFVSIHFLRTDALRLLVDLGIPSMEINAFDRELFREFGTKMGARAWAAAAAAVASDSCPLMRAKLARYLLANDDLWSADKPDPTTVARHLAPFIDEYKRLMGID